MGVASSLPQNVESYSVQVGTVPNLDDCFLLHPGVPMSPCYLGLSAALVHFILAVASCVIETTRNFLFGF